MSVLQEKPHAHPAGPAQGGPPGPGGCPPRCAGCGLREQRGNLGREGRPSALAGRLPAAWAPTLCATRGGGRGAFGPAGPAQGHEEALKRLRGTRVPWKQILLSPTWAADRPASPPVGACRNSFRALTKGEKANVHRAPTVCLATRRALRASGLALRRTARAYVPALRGGRGAGAGPPPHCCAALCRLRRGPRRPQSQEGQRVNTRKVLGAGSDTGKLK